MDEREVAVMIRIERATARNLRDHVAAHRTVAPHARSDSIDVAGGVAASTGTGSPFTTVKGAAARLTPHDLDLIESFLGDHQPTTVTIEMAPWLDDDTQQLLLAAGYQIVGHEDVVTTPAGTPSPTSSPFNIETVSPATWPDVAEASSDLPAGTPTGDLVIAAAHLANARLFGIRDAGSGIACAPSVNHDDVVIFGNDATRPEARHRGAQTALIGARVHAPGTIAMAEVAPGSGSERNDLRGGFRLAYTRTHDVRALTPK